jgi:hypothetical protein
VPLRFWRRVRIAPGVTLNLGKSGTSVSLGPRGARTTIGHGRVRQTVGLPGTGLFYTRTVGQPAAPAHDRAEPEVVAPAQGSVVGTMPPVPWQATLVIMAFLSGIVIAVYPGSALAFIVAGTPVALLLAWLLRRHPLALGVLIGVAIIAVITIVLEVVVGALAAGTSGGTSRRRRR